MSAYYLVEDVAAMGIALDVDGDEVVLRGDVDDDLVSKVRACKPDLLSALSALRERAGDDWSEISSDPEQLEAFAILAETAEMRSRGEVPKAYTAMTNCRRCGPVPIWPGLPPKIAGCPWCFNRVKGLPMPEQTPLDEPPEAT